MDIEKEKYYTEKFENCYLNDFRKILSFANGYLNDYDFAKNIAQEAFIALWNNREKVDFESDLLPYLFYITKNKCLNQLDKRKSNRKYTDYTIGNAIDALNYNALSHMSSTSIYTKEVEKLTAEALNSLPAKIKETYLLSRKGDYKYSDIADKYNVSVKTIEYRIMVALKTLRKYLKDYL